MYIVIVFKTLVNLLFRIAVFLVVFLVIFSTVRLSMKRVLFLPFLFVQLCVSSLTALTRTSGMMLNRIGNFVLCCALFVVLERRHSLCHHKEHTSCGFLQNVPVLFSFLSFYFLTYAFKSSQEGCEAPYHCFIFHHLSFCFLLSYFKVVSRFCFPFFVPEIIFKHLH